MNNIGAIAPDADAADGASSFAEDQRQKTLLKTGALQTAILNSANFSSIATDERGVIQIFNVGAERMLGYAASEVVNRITPADISDPQELLLRAQALSAELATPIAPGFEALVFKARRGIEDAYELTYIRKDGCRLPAVVSVTALQDAAGVIIGYLLIGTDNTARKLADGKLRAAGQYARSLIEASLDPLVTISAEGKITDVNEGSVHVTGVSREKLIGTDFSDYFTEPVKAREGYREAFSKGSVTDYPLTIRRDDGRLTDVLYNASIYRDVQGQVLGVFAAARDVTAQKKSEAKFRGFLETAPDGVVIVDAMGQMVLVNARTERLFGYERHEMLGQQVELLIPSRLHTKHHKHRDGFIEERKARGMGAGLELYGRRKDGSEFPIEVSLSPLETEAGVLVSSSIRDVTQQKQASQYARSLIEASLDPLVTISPEGKITDVNQGSVEVTGVARDRLIGADFCDYFTEPDKAREGYREAFLKGSVTDYPLTIRHHNGRLTDVLYNASVYKDVQGTVLGVFAAARDITARKQAEEALLKAGALQRAIFESANFSSIATDANGVIQIFNVGAERMLGYTAAEVMNKITPADISDPQEVIARATALSLELGTPITPGFEALVFKASRGIEDIYELTYIRKDRSRFPAVVSVTALRDAQEAIIGYLLIGTDNTARQQVEAERKRLDEVLKVSHLELEKAKVAAEEANLAKSDFLSSMSHELRSPLNAILGFAQLMETGTPLPTPAQKDSIDQILQAGWYLLELINEILDLALVESGKLSLSLESMSLGEVLADCQAMIEPQVHKSGIAVHFPTPQAPWVIRADRTRVKQVLLNLLSNAIKYNRVGGRVDVRCEAGTAGRTRVSVQDTGEGLSADKLSQLFQSFNRLGQEAGSQEGTGIGLVMSKRLVELMGGRIGVDSSVGVGSVFWFELDSSAALQAIAEPDDVRPATALTSTTGAARRTLLYVEDNPANLLLVQRLVERRTDIRMLSAPDGRSGVEMAHAHQPDVILMDINLPGINGITALRVLAESAETAHITVVALSANAMPHDIEKGLQAGFFRYMTKPIKVGEFMATLDAALAHAQTKKNGEPE